MGLRNPWNQFKVHTEFCFLINEENVTISKDFHSEIYDIFRLSF